MHLNEMALSLGNHRRAQTSSTAWSAQQQRQSSSLLVRKQHSFIESGTSGSISYVGNGRGYLTRGLSVGRSFDNYRDKLLLPVGGGRQKHSANIRLQNHVSIDHDHIKNRITSKSNQLPFKNFTKDSHPSRSNARIGSTSNISERIGEDGDRMVKTTLKEGRSSRIVAWSSTSSLLRSLDEEISQVIGVLDRKQNPSVDSSGSKHKTKLQQHQSLQNDHLRVKRNQPLMPNGSHSQQSLTSSKSEVNKVNLNIVLSQTLRATEENEAVLSDFDSSSECAEITSSFSTQGYKNSDRSPINKTTEPSISSGEIVPASFITARAQFSRHATTTSVTNATSPTSISILPTSVSTQNNNISNFSASPSLTIQRRPPLVRAMSAPVRTLDENSKSVFAASKRKSRRRKLLSREVSCDKIETVNFNDNKSKDLILESNKKVLSRARSVVAPDVVTLVSLISSEGSDSEKEDISSTTTATNSDISPTRRAPSLRKTGKSVSFQENYPPNFQLAAKEYSHMIRRGSIAPLAARIRASRPPTAPPVSIFLNDLNNTDSGMTSPTNDKPKGASISPSEGEKKMSPNGEKAKNSTTGPLVVSPPEYVFPDYVRSIKERECWKLFQKMSKKGVNVTYDVILRGMLTPTEFRQLQKQREFEEAKLRESEELATNVEEKVKAPTSAIERLSETLLKK